LSLFCEEVSFPEKIINTKPARIHNLDIQRPLTVQYGGNVFLTFIVDGAWSTKRYFDVWTEFVIDKNREIGQYKDIIGQIDVYAIHETNTSITPAEHKEETPYHIRLLEAFPTMVSNMTTNNTNIGIHRFTVGFAFKKWEVVLEQSNPALVSPSARFKPIIPER
jgi:hypothetical protein